MKLYNKLSIAYVAFIVLFFMQVVQLDTGVIYHEPQSATGRNENSTPRIFVLPSTPAVAAEQEKLQKLLDNEPKIKLCMLALIDKGYSVGNIEAVDNIHVVVSLIRFQSASQIEVTGEFDADTSDKLGC